MRSGRLPLFTRRLSPICPYNSGYKGLQSATACSFQRPPASKSVFDCIFPSVRKPCGDTLRRKKEKEEETKKKTRKIFKRAFVRNGRRCRFAGAADFARHLKPHINHLLCESDLNTRGGVGLLWSGGVGRGHFRRSKSEPPT